MSKSNKIIPLVFMSVLVGIFAHAYMQDSDFDGVPNDEDEFPNNMNEWNDNDKDGIGDNEDTDDDNDGYNDTDDLYPQNYKEQI